MSVRVGQAANAAPFPEAAREAMKNGQLRRNVRHATGIIGERRGRMVAEKADWEALRDAGHAIKEHTLRYLDKYLMEFETNCVDAGGQVHWARDADEANALIVKLIRSREGREVIKVKTMTSDEIQLNPALEAAGITPIETDLADLIIQLGADKPSHIVVPALHKNRREIRRLFSETMGLPSLGDRPEDLAEAARRFLREKFLTVPIGLSGANFLVAESGAVGVVESEGNGRMCVTLPDMLITLAGIEKVIPRWEDLGVFLQTLPRSATGERMNPYNSLWTGVAPGDGPREFHVILLDNGRTRVLRNERTRETLDCIRCGACLNACPVYRQTGGHAYGSIYAGPIGAILSPQLQAMEHSDSLPYASSLCGACYDVCPVKINIPEILVALRAEVVDRGRAPLSERAAMRLAAFFLSSASRFAAAQKLLRLGQRAFERNGVITHLPGFLGGWTAARDLAPAPPQSFREWWASHKS